MKNLTRLLPARQSSIKTGVLQQNPDSCLTLAPPRSPTDRARINELIQHAKKATGSVQDALIEKGYEYLRNVCEVIVETDLLQGVTQRYQPNVMMTKLPHIKVERLKAAVYGIMPIFEKACRLIASHSQPMETLNVRPSLADLESDWKAVQDLRDTYVKD